MHWHVHVHFCYYKKSWTPAIDEVERKRLDDEIREEIRHYKFRVSQYESEAAGYEEKLGMLKKEGKYRTSYVCV